MIKYKELNKIRNKDKAIQRRLGAIYDINIGIDIYNDMGDYAKAKELQYKSKILEWEIIALKQGKGDALDYIDLMGHRHIKRESKRA